MCSCVADSAKVDNVGDALSAFAFHRNTVAKVDCFWSVVAFAVEFDGVFHDE